MQGIFFRFMAVHRPLVSKLNSLLGQYGLSYSLWQVVNYLKANGPSSLVDIANYYNIEKPSVTRRAYHLEEKAIVETIPSRDRREKVLQLTESGEALYQACREKITEFENNVMSGIPEEIQKIVFEALPAIRKNIIDEKER